MTAPAASMARGTVRRASSISSPIVDPLSTPPNANAIVDQKITSLRPVLGTSDEGVIGVADPNRYHDTTPRPISSSAGIHPAIAPTLFSHLPTFSPTTFIVTAIARPTTATAMKYVLLVDSACHEGPPMKSALAAREVQQAREVRQVRSPVRPAGDERGERAERLLAPDVEPALLRIARRQLEDGEDERHEEAERRDHPDDERARARGGGRRDPAEAEAGDDVEEEQVAEAEGFAKLGRRHGVWAG